LNLDLEIEQLVHSYTRRFAYLQHLTELMVPTGKRSERPRGMLLATRMAPLHAEVHTRETQWHPRACKILSKNAHHTPNPNTAGSMVKNAHRTLCRMCGLGLPVFGSDSCPSKGGADGLRRIAEESAAALHAALCPFHALFWHAAPQYSTCWHALHRLKHFFPTGLAPQWLQQLEPV
jgi:hypothetical protein